MDIRDLIRESHATAVEKGWWDGPARDRPILEQLMLMVTELAEATEEVRAGHPLDEIYYNQARTVLIPDGFLEKPEGFLAELADLFIRVGDTLGRYELTDKFLQVLAEKLTYNKYRPYRHGNKTA